MREKQQEPDEYQYQCAECGEYHYAGSGWFIDGEIVCWICYKEAKDNG